MSLNIIKSKEDVEVDGCEGRLGYSGLMEGHPHARLLLLVFSRGFKFQGG